MKNFFYVLLFAITSCTLNTNKKQDVNDTFEQDLEKYENIWTQFLSGDTTVINEANFHQDVIVVTSNGDLVGIEAIKDF